MLTAFAAIGAMSCGASAARAQDVEPEPEFLRVPPGPRRAVGPPPTREAARALRELEGELDAFAARSGTYRDALRTMATRERETRRGAMDRDFARRIGFEQQLETSAREDAIARIERFLAAHPDDADESPRAMLRLGELYYEESVAALDAHPEAAPDFERTIALYRELVARFPRYARRDAALYLLGHCLDRVGRTDEAVVEWRRAVCAEMRDASCVAASDDRELVAEMWLRIGEHEFDSGEEGANDRAIAAYLRALESPAERARSLALYKLAWAYYRDGRYPEAIARFTDLVEASDAHHARTGRAGSELRTEAIQYVALSLAERDWDGDNEDDRDAPLARATDATIVPQDRPWTVEVLVALGTVAFDEGRYEDAIAVLDDVTSRWPLDHRVPSAIARIARAQDRLGRAAEAQQTRARLTAYARGSEWARHNRREHPTAVDDADRLAETLVRIVGVDAAIRCHEHAQTLNEAGRSAASDAAYACAVNGYRAYLQGHAEDLDAYEVTYDLGEALFWSRHYEEAASVFATVRDSGTGDHLEATSARRVVESYRRALEASGTSVRDEAPEPGTRPEVPALLAELARAREIYLTRIDDARDTEHVRDAYAFNQALLLDQYGYPQHASERFEAILAAPGCGEVPSSAYRALRAIVTRTANDAAAERLATAYRARDCAAPLASGRGAECDTSACENDAVCTARCDLQVFAYRRGLDAYARAETLQEPERARTFEEAATLLVRAVDDAPDHPGVPRALLVAGDALDRAGLHGSAARIYERSIEELSPRRAATPARQLEIDRALANAWLALGRSAMRVLDHERAARAFEAVATGERFSGSSDADVVAARTNAAIALARVHAALGEYDAAAEAYRRIASAPTATAEEVRIASFEAAEMSYRAQDDRAGTRAMTAFAERWPDDPEHTPQAYARIAESARARGRDTEERAALERVIAAYERSGAVPGSHAAGLAAEARVRLARHAARAFDGLHIDPGHPATLEAYVASLRRQLSDGAARASTASRGFDPVPAYGDAHWTIAALVAQGEIDEHLARAVIAAPFVMPSDVERQLRHASPAVRDEARVDIEARIAASLDEQARPIECMAIVRYTLAARLARRTSIADEASRTAIDRLSSFGEERLAECIEAEHARDPSFEPYRPDELARAHQGATAPTLAADIAPPSLAE